ncbi:hypothetical protein [Streptomyces rubrogriseus]|uniref:hypothetical protein n=1 Tax=Streptomyces rubrogriseus TaxID=194673 RepID=UPI000D599F90|nr:hypothetical protein [Streptomyces rubrogriseus]
MSVHRDLAWALKQQAQRVGEQAPSVRGADWRQAVVTAVGTDGTVAADEIPAIRCLQSYLAPAVGDVIVISQSSMGNWLAHGRLTSTTPAWTTLPLAGGWTANASYYAPAYRLWGDGTASLCGLAQMSGTLTSGTTVATLPLEAQPAAGVRAAVQVAIGYFGAMTISTNGAIQLGDFSGTLPTTGNKYAEYDVFGRYRLK